MQISTGNFQTLGISLGTHNRYRDFLRLTIAISSRIRKKLITAGLLIIAGKKTRSSVSSEKK
jgi:hypothetical protein